MSQFQIGDKVAHDTYGRGVVRKPGATASSLSVSFNRGGLRTVRTSNLSHESSDQTTTDAQTSPPTMTNTDSDTLGHIVIRDDAINEAVETVRLEIAGSGAKMTIVEADAEPGRYELVRNPIDSE